MASTDKELEQQLVEAGNRLSELPSSVDELLPLLDQVENFLSRVEQSPPKTIQNAYSPSMKALVDDKLLSHSDVDVKVAVASCISEITRITAPDAPYDDDKMKDVFQLIVSSFENLSEKSSRSYNKRASILETVAKVRSCVVMLDLECDGLIVEMFQHFLKAIRDYHPENVFMSMETIMTLVLEESEDISLELLTPILASLKKDNEEFPSIARKLGERVFENCAAKLKPYLTQVLKSSGVSLDDYSKVVASICAGTTGAVELNDDNVSGEKLAEESKLAKASPDEAAQADDSKLTTASSDETAQVDKENVTEEDCPEEVHPDAERSPKSVTSNGIVETGNEGTSVDHDSSKKPDEGHFTNESLDVDLTNKLDTDDSDAGKSVKSESKPEKTAQMRGRKPNSILNSTEPSDSSRFDSDEEAEKLPDPRKSHNKDTHTSSGKDQHVDTGVPSENEEEAAVQISSPKALDSEAVNVASPSPSESLPDESRSKTAGWPKKKENLAQEDAPSVDPISTKVSDGTSDSEVKPPKAGWPKKKENLAHEDAPSVDPVSVKVSDGTSDSEVKPQGRSRKKVTARMTKEEKILAGRTSKTEDETDSEAKPLRQSAKKRDASDSEAKPLKPQGRSGKKATDRITKEEKILAGSTSKTEDETDSEEKPLRQSAKKGDASDSEAKPLKQSGKKGETSRSEGKPLKQSGKKGNASDSEIKSLKQSCKKEDTSNNEDTVSSKKDDGKRRGRGKDTTERDLLKSHAKDDVKEMISSPKSKSKSVKDEDHLEEDPKTNSKRKRTPDKDKVSGNIEYGANLIGSKIKVWWPKDLAYYEGVIDSFDHVKKRHKVFYTDGDEETLNLQKERWELIKDEAMQEEANEDSNPDSSTKTHKKKKAKTNSEPLPKQEKMDVSAKRDGAASSSKSKGTATKSGRKADDGKVDSKSKDKTSEPSGKCEDNLRGNNDKFVDDVTRAARKSKDVDGSTPKTTAKSKQETPKTVTKTKAKNPQGGNKSSSNGTGKVKSSSSKAKETEDAKKGKTSDSAKTLDTVKGKSPDMSKTRESEAKTGKKRRRGR